MIHHADQYDPPQYRIHCTEEWVDPDFDKDVAPYDDIFIAKGGKGKYTPVVEYVTCPDCLRKIRQEER